MIRSQGINHNQNNIEIGHLSGGTGTEQQGKQKNQHQDRIFFQVYRFCLHVRLLINHPGPEVPGLLYILAQPPGSVNSKLTVISRTF
jgi:hypothetical protein